MTTTDLKSNKQIIETKAKCLSLEARNMVMV